MKTPLRLHLLQSNLLGPLSLPDLMVLINVPVLKGYSRHCFSFFIRRKKILRRQNYNLFPLSGGLFFFFPITVLSILLPIFSNFFLSSKDFLLIYSTLQFHVPPSNNFPFSPQCLSSQHLTLLPPRFFHLMTSSLTHNHNWVGFCHPCNSGSVGYLINSQSLTV